MTRPTHEAASEATSEQDPADYASFCIGGEIVIYDGSTDSWIRSDVAVSREEVR